MVLQRTEEIERFKTEINLSEYAATVGFVIDRQESSRRSIVMRNASDKIAIARNPNMHYVYYSFRDELDNGTIIDFIQNRHERNIGRIRKELRPWIGEGGQSPTPPVLNYYQKEIEPTEKNRQAILLEFSKQEEITGLHRYLTAERLIPESVYLSARFKGRIYTDKYKNAVFPHYDDNGLCGFEKKNKNYTGFTRGGTKTIWISNCFKTDVRLVVVESGIEALSHYALFKNEGDRYCSMSGSWSEDALKLIINMHNKFKGETVLAFNNDEPGLRLIEKFKGAIGEKGKSVSSELPKEGGDWNELLKQISGSN